MGEEFSRDAFELVFAAAEEHHFVWFFLFTMYFLREATYASRLFDGVMTCLTARGMFLGGSYCAMAKAAALEP